MLVFLNSFTLLSHLSLSNTVSNIACKIDEEELHSVFVPRMHISAIHRMKKYLVMSAKRSLCRYKSFSCLTLYFFRLFSASAIRCSMKFDRDRRTDGHLRNLLYYDIISKEFASMLAFCFCPLFCLIPLSIHARSSFVVQSPGTCGRRMRQTRLQPPTPDLYPDTWKTRLDGTRGTDVIKGH